MQYWCSKCQKLVVAHTTTTVSKLKKFVKYSCPHCHSTIMIDEYANYNNQL